MIKEGLDEALDEVRSENFPVSVEDIYVIGGGALYKDAIASNYCSNVYMTR